MKIKITVEVVILQQDDYFVAYCPALIKSSTGVLAIDKEVVTRKLGRMELLHSAIYVFLIILVYCINPLKSGCERIGYCGVTH